MKKFAEFLNESTKTWSEQDFSAVLAGSHRAENVRAAEALRTRYLPRLIKYLNDYRTGDVPNPVFQGIKDTANSFAEYGTNYPDYVYAVIRGNRDLNSYDYDVSGMHVVPGKLKKAEAALKKATTDAEKVFFGFLVPVLRELAPVAAAVEDMKSRIVKRVPKTDAEKAATKQAFIAPFVKSEVGQQIRDVLKKQTDGIKDAYVARIVKYTTAQVEKFAAMSLEEQSQQRKDAYRVTGRPPAALTYSVWKKNDGYRDERYELSSNYKQTLLSLAERDANAMQEDFMYKTSKKLAAIVDAKKIPLAKDPELLGGMDRTTFEGDIRITFTDNSRFDVRNKIIIKSNRYGTVFNQFPTTFHNVVLPDGSKMPSPSEERLNTVFAKA